MNISKKARIVTAVILMTGWAGLAVLNFGAAAPYLYAKLATGWSLDDKIDQAIKTANGRIVFQDVIHQAYGKLIVSMGRKTAGEMTIVKGADGRLTYSNFYPFETHSHYREAALRIKRLKAAAEERGAGLLYVNCLDLYYESRDSYPLPAANFNPRSDAFIYALNGYGLDYLDAREVLKVSPLPPARYRYKTEPHWTIEAAFEVYLKIMENLEKTKGVQGLQSGFFTDRGNFNFIEYPQSYLGKLGKRAGIPFSGCDDFTVITPAFETSFTYTDDRISRRGDFDSVIMDKRLMEAENPYDRDLYSAYLYDVYPLRKIQNNQNPQGPRLLVVGDSHMLPVAAFLALAAGEVHLFWPYGLPNNTESLAQYVRANSFDDIIIGLSPMTLYQNGFNFLSGLSSDGY